MTRAIVFPNAGSSVAAGLGSLSALGSGKCFLQLGGNGWLGFGSCSGSGADAFQTPDDHIPPAQSRGVWELSRAMLIFPDPEN